MGIRLSQLVVDSRDPAALAAWWATALGWVVEEDDDEDEVWISPVAGGEQGLLFLRVEEPKTGKNRLHLDVRPQAGSSQAAELARLLEMGARRVDVGQGEAAPASTGPDAPAPPEGTVTWFVLADPEGNEFCLLRSTFAQLAAEAAAATA